MEKQYVDNDVFRYRVHLKWDLNLDDVTVYVKPFPQPWDKDYDESKDTLSLEEKEDLVQEKYFTKEKIMTEENPFEISCVDVDGGYYVTEDQLFKF